MAGLDLPRGQEVSVFCNIRNHFIRNFFQEIMMQWKKKIHQSGRFRIGQYSVT